MKTRTQEEIDRQIAGIQREKARNPEFTTFGDPNWKAFDAMIAILKREKTIEDIYEEIGEGESDYILEYVQSADTWLQGFDDTDLFEDPSS